MSQLKPYAFCNGDESARRAATMTKDIVFNDFPSVDVDTGVDARIETNDECIKKAAEAIRDCGSGVKISTASDHANIKAKGWKFGEAKPLTRFLGINCFVKGARLVVPDAVKVLAP